ncbi:N,N-dimethylformamidase beta subunit family domain-containing protein [Amycolatopsis cihanbeyliensis]|uniref:N,N-dimethylformamidase n=1 Tax=Amycolatopsis cihanbeyliensis TaxID=1128664 RepID=A0A542CSG8_AMYCI|nr:N,N-dimethylformamidase beta subunit family domain-containing protein [Amycolatopsis cihanbeyliensis]TQI93764.1 N,N-dimethylformamidase [Amycolatopsis cihanbeyliensis]
MTRRPVDHSAAAVVGYTDRFSLRPGERIAVSASARSADCAVRVLRISHDGREPVRTPVRVGAPESVRLPHQDFDFGSFGRVPAPPPIGGAIGFACWLWPTALPQGRAAIISQGQPEAGPYAALYLLADGRPAFEVRTGQGVVAVDGELALRPRRWYLLAGGYDPAGGAYLLVLPRDPLAGECGAGEASVPPLGELTVGAAPLLLGGRAEAGTVVDNLDGKLDAPCVFDRVPTAGELTELAAGQASPSGLGATAHWDLACDISGDHMLDPVGGHHGRLHNQPLRAVTGHDWAGDVLDWRHADRGYGAVHFHSDDLADAGWDPAFTLDLPAELDPGCYAIELSTTDGVDRVPFFVRPRLDTEKAPLLLLVPTLSYLAYALDHLRQPVRPEDPREVAARFARDNLLHSLYDRHTDGSGVCTASSLRPLLGMRDDHLFRYLGAAHQYSEDVQLIGWLERQGFAFDLLTDHDLDAEGARALGEYRAVITGSHPEYWTGAMLDAVKSYVDGGGKLGYLGGNGAYWVTAIAGDRRQIAELRRGFSGVRTWEAEPGELHLASTGEPGGLWAERGRSPHTLFGIGSTAAGMTTGTAYRLTPDPGDPAADLILAGVDRSAPLGGYGSVLDGAASFETDGVDVLLGSPPDITLLGRAMLGEEYMSACTGPAFGHPRADPVDDRRADLTLLRRPGGGAVFATGSIGWCGALSHAEDDNDVSRVTANVLRWFVSE